MDLQTVIVFILGVANVWLGWLLRAQSAINKTQAENNYRLERDIHAFKNEVHTSNMNMAVNYVPNTRFEKVMEAITTQIKEIGKDVKSDVRDLSVKIDNVDAKLDRKADR